MSNDEVTPHERPLPSPLPPVKSQVATTEMWMAIATSLSTILTSLSSKTSGTGAIIAALFSVIVTAVTYAALRSPLSALKSGWKTPMFWGAVATIVGSAALAVSETNIPGLPPGVTQIAAIVTSGIAASGYTVYRHMKKAT